jgi:arylsulfatase A-like enzyme
LMIILDDLNDYAGCLGGYDGPSPTPNIDALADRGLLFTNAHCNAPLCNPSRTSVMTGKHPSSTGVYSNRPVWFEAVPDAVSLPEAFRKNGYAAVGCGKVFHTPDSHHPTDIWDAFFHMVKTPLAKPPNHGIEALKKSTTADDFDWGRQDMSDLETGDGQAVQWAMDQLEKDYDKPLFMAVGIFRPHLPLYAPSGHFDKFPLADVEIPVLPPQDLNDVPPVGLALREYEKEYFEETDRVGRVDEVVQAYLASCSLADALVGRLLKAFEASPYAKDAIIVLWSDHGWHLGEKNKFQKHALWEPATRVPLIVVAPGLTHPRSRSGEAVSLIDLYPTLMDLCDLPVSDELDGQTLRPLLENPQASWDKPAVITFGYKNHAVRDEHWKYIRYNDGTEELYDMKVDPNEWTNLAGVAKLQPIKQRLSSWLPKKNAPAALPDAFPNKLPLLTGSR